MFEPVIPLAGSFEVDMIVERQSFRWKLTVDV
jgi:hypothetical protein